MVATFPLSLADFLKSLPVSKISFTLPEAVEVSRTAGGDIATASLGMRLWQGEVVLGRLKRTEAHNAEALIDLARGSEASFMATPLHRAGPQLDPLGAGLGLYTPRIRELPIDARVLSLKGLKPDYQLKRGDYLAFIYRSSPTRFALHRVVDATVVANASGDTPLFEVRPHIRPGAVVNAAVTLINPACKAIIVPDSVQPGRTSRFVTEGQSFSFLQTLR